MKTWFLTPLALVALALFWIVVITWSAVDMIRGKPSVFGGEED